MFVLAWLLISLYVCILGWYVGETVGCSVGWLIGGLAEWIDGSADWRIVGLAGGILNRWLR